MLKDMAQFLTDHEVSSHNNGLSDVNSRPFPSKVEESKSEDENQEEEWSTKERSQLLEMTKRLKEANDAIGYMIAAVEWNFDGQIFLTKKLLHVMIISYLQKWHRCFWLVGWLVERN